MNRFTQSNLLKIAAVFLLLQTLIMTLSPGVRARTWETDYRWWQWLGFGVWGVFTWFAHQAILKRLPDADPYLFPAAALLSGWGLLTVWRLDPIFGFRQMIWLGVSMFVLYFGTRRPTSLDSVRKYKYLFWSAG